MICNKSILDHTYPDITFDKSGISNIFKESKFVYDFFIENLSKRRDDFLNLTIKDIKKSKPLGEYNCILGLSGGLDSSYMLHKVVNDYGLKPLVFHVDAGWNSEIAVSNIEKLVDKLDLDLFTEVVNWNDVKNLQIAFLKSGVPHIDIPQDHAFISILYNFAEKYKIKYILNGGNIFNEIVPMPYKYYYWGTDLRHIKDIISKFSPEIIKKYPFSSVFRHKIYLRFFKSLKVIKPLNFEIYNQSNAIKILNDTYGWKPYGQKHFESNFTRFYEGYWLPSRFNFDVRRCQLSSLIISNQMTREEAIKTIKNPPLTKTELLNDYNYVANKLDLSEEQLMRIENSTRKYYYNYKNLHYFLKPIEKFLKASKLMVRGGAY
jgi:N-acetyl sugar amidotransferase